MRRVRVSAAFLMLLFLCSCGSWNIFMRNSQDEFVQAANSFGASGDRYRAAVNDIVRLRAAGQVTDAQWTRLKANEATVRDAGQKAWALFGAWVVNGGKRSDKPKGMDAALAAVNEGENAVMALAVEVKIKTSMPQP